MRCSGRAKHNVEVLPSVSIYRLIDGSIGAEGAGSTAHGTEAEAHELYIIRC